MAKAQLMGQLASCSKLSSAEGQPRTQCEWWFWKRRLVHQPLVRVRRAAAQLLGGGKAGHCVEEGAKAVDSRWNVDFEAINKNV